MRRTLRVLLATVSFLLAAGLLAAAARADTVTTSTIHKTPDFAESVQVNAHPDYGPGTFTTGNAWQLYTPGYGAPLSYEPWQTWKKWACDSGVRVLRAGLKPWPWWGPDGYGNHQINDLSSSCGVKWVLMVGRPKNLKSDGTRDADYTGGVEALRRGYFPKGIVHAVELENEADNFYWAGCWARDGDASGLGLGTAGPVRRCTIPEWAARVRDQAQGVHDGLAAFGWDDVPILAPDFIKSGPGPGPGGYPEQPDPYDVGDLSAWVDYGVVHPYRAGQVPEGSLGSATDPLSARYRASITAPGKPIWVTEWGFHTGAKGAPPHPGVDEATQATYLVRGWADFADQGVAGATDYELLDEYPNSSGSNGENHFGLMRRDFTPKPAYAAVQRLLTYFQDTGAVVVKPAQVKVQSPAGVPVRVAAFQRPNGRMVILVWRAVSVWDRVAYLPLAPASQSVSVSVYRPDWAWGMYADKDRPDTPGNFGAAGPSPPNQAGWRTWSGYNLDGRLLLLNIRY